MRVSTLLKQLQNADPNAVIRVNGYGTQVKSAKQLTRGTTSRGNKIFSITTSDS